MRLLDLDGLRQKGIKFTRQHIHRLVRRGLFPRPVKVGIATNAWIESEIDEYLANRVTQRDRLAAA